LFLRAGAEANSIALSFPDRGRRRRPFWGKMSKNGLPKHSEVMLALSGQIILHLCQYLPPNQR
jgi:hypothetical protein